MLPNHMEILYFQMEAVSSYSLKNTTYLWVLLGSKIYHLEIYYGRNELYCELNKFCEVRSLRLQDCKLSTNELHLKSYSEIDIKQFPKYFSCSFIILYLSIVVLISQVGSYSRFYEICVNCFDQNITSHTN